MTPVALEARAPSDLVEQSRFLSIRMTHEGVDALRR
jgi:hypothetical protein